MLKNKEYSEILKKAIEFAGLEIKKVVEGYGESGIGYVTVDFEYDGEEMFLDCNKEAFKPWYGGIYSNTNVPKGYAYRVVVSFPEEVTQKLYFMKPY